MSGAKCLQDWAMYKWSGENRIHWEIQRKWKKWDFSRDLMRRESWLCEFGWGGHSRYSEWGGKSTWAGRREKTQYWHLWWSSEWGMGKCQKWHDVRGHSRVLKSLEKQDKKFSNKGKFVEGFKEERFTQLEQQARENNLVIIAWMGSMC